MDTERDMENFVRDYGTGNAIYDPPQFVNYASPDAVPPASQRPSSRPAKFSRIVQRQGPPTTQFPEEEPQPDPEPINITGVGAGGGHRRAESISDPQQTGRARSHSRASNRQSYIHPPEQTNGHAANGTITPYGAMRPADPQAEPINPTATTMLKVGDRAYEVDLTSNPQARASSAQNVVSGVGQNDDPLAKQMEQLRNTAGSSASGSVRRSQQYNQGGPPSASIRTNGNLSPPPGSRGGGPPNRDYRLSAEIVVGGLPPGVTPSRPTSPRAPSPIMMQPAAPQPGVADVRAVLNNYEQSLPGERKSVSRPPSQASFISPPAQSSQQNRRLSTDGHAGIGAQGRSTSPQPYMGRSGGASPQQAQPVNGGNRRNSYRAPVPGAIVASSPTSHTSRQSSISVPQISPHQQRPTSPNSVGIALGPDGRVVEDSMADRYKNQQYGGHPGYRPIQQQPPPPTTQPPPPPQQAMQPVQQQPHHLAQRTPSYPPPTQPPYGAPPPAPGYMQNYAQQPPPPVAGQPPPGHPSYIQQRGPEPNQYGPPVHAGYQPQPAVNYGNPAPNGGPVQGAPPPNAYVGYGQPPNGQVVHQPNQPQQLGAYPRAPSPARSPQPQVQRQSNPQPPPTGQYTEDGRGVLFYGKFFIQQRIVI